MATLCSGTDGGINVAVDYIDKGLGGVGSPWVHLFACDKDPQVQRWLAQHSKARHIFPDVTRLICQDGKQVDARSGKSAVVPGALIAIAGTSCKQFSALCIPGKRAKTLGATNLGRDRSSVKTMMGLLAYVETTLPGILILENVQGIESAGDDEGTSVLDDVLARLRLLGYLTWSMMVDAYRCGSPQQRRRVWYGGLLSQLDCDDENFIARNAELERDIRAAIRRMSAANEPALAEFLLPDDDPRVAGLRDNNSSASGCQSDAWVHVHGRVEQEVASIAQPYLRMD